MKVQVFGECEQPGCSIKIKPQCQALEAVYCRNDSPDQK